MFYDGSGSTLIIAAVRDIQFAYDAFPGASVAPAAHPSICDRMLRDIAENPQGTTQSYYVDPAVDIPVVEPLSPLIVSSTTPSPVVDAPVRLIAPNNRSLCYMQSGPTDQPQLQVPLSRGAVSSTDFLQNIEPLPMDQLLYHDVHAVRAWLEAARDEILAVAQSDVCDSDSDQGVLVFWDRV